MKKPETGWRVDLKWIFAIFFTIAFSFSLFFFIIFRASTENAAKQSLKTVVTDTIGVLPNETYLSLINQAKKKPTDQLMFDLLPIPLNIKNYQTLNLTKDKLNELIVKQAAAYIYDNNLDNKKINSQTVAYEQQYKKFQEESSPLIAQTLKTKGQNLNPQELQKLAQKEGPLAMNEGFGLSFLSLMTPLTLVLSKAAHAFSLIMFILTGILSLLFLAGLLIFSYRFGKLTSLGIALFFASFPGFVVFSFLKILIDYSANLLPGIGLLVQKVTSGIASNVVSQNGTIFLVLIILSLIFVFLGIILESIFRIAKKPA